MKKIKILIGLLFLLTTVTSQEISEPTLIGKKGNEELDIPFQKWEYPMDLPY